MKSELLIDQIPLSALALAAGGQALRTVRGEGKDRTATFTIIPLTHFTSTDLLLATSRGHNTERDRRSRRADKQGSTVIPILQRFN